MIKKVKVYLYTGIVFFIFIFCIEKLGFFDINQIEVDNFIIKKPILYKIVSDIDNKIILDEKKSFLVTFLSAVTNDTSTYFIQKRVNKKKYINLVKDNLNLKNIDLSYCYISKKEMHIDLENKETKIKKDIFIYSYPYYMNFTELNNKIEDEMINHFCMNHTPKLIIN